MVGFKGLREQVSEIINQRDLKMQDVAAIVGVSPQRFSYILSTTKTSAKVIERIADALDVDPWYFDEYVLIHTKDVVRSHPALLSIIRQVGRYPNSPKTKKLIRSL
jgi:transcriptional regulator with XRE-family HTH domain